MEETIKRLNEITERLNTVQNANTHNLRVILEHLPFVVAQFDKDYRHTFINRRVSEELGISPEQIVGKTNRELDMPDEVCDTWEAGIKRTFESREIQKVVIKYEDGRVWDTTMIPERTNGSVRSVITITSRVHTG